MDIVTTPVAQHAIFQDGNVTFEYPVSAKPSRVLTINIYLFNGYYVSQTLLIDASGTILAGPSHMPRPDHIGCHYNRTLNQFIANHRGQARQLETDFKYVTGRE